jgi:hypothetical protein
MISRDSILQFCDVESNRCLVVPESLKFDTIIPSKLSKGKVLMFIKLRTCVLKMDNIFTDVRLQFLKSKLFASKFLKVCLIYYTLYLDCGDRAQWSESFRASRVTGE